MKFTQLMDQTSSLDIENVEISPERYALARKAALVCVVLAVIALIVTIVLWCLHLDPDPGIGGIITCTTVAILLALFSWPASEEEKQIVLDEEPAIELP